MKKFSHFLVASIAVTVLMTIQPVQVKAQKFQGQSVVTGGVGFSLAGFLMEAVKDAINTTNASSTKTPVIIGSYDYGISDRFSVGVSYTYQGLTIKYSSYQNQNGDTIVGDFKDRLTRQNFAIRPLFHFGDSDDLDIYAGLRLGYTMWNYNSSQNSYDSQDVISGFGSPIKVQALFGMRYFFTENIGFNTEVAVGPTYFAMVGLNARFGGQ